MGFIFVIKQLERNKNVFESILISKTKNEYLWRPSSEKWCLLEIICHLLDEEREDFRARVKHTLENPKDALKPIDPKGWVKERNYMTRDYNQTLQTFLKEGIASISWLKTHTDAHWGKTVGHPKLGELSAELFLTNWLAHDYLHIRQILKYEYHYLREKTNIDLSYAGNW